MTNEERIAKAACVQAAATLMAASRADRPNWPPQSEAVECAKVAEVLYKELFATKYRPAPALHNPLP